jgi:hypothetical protein
MTQWKKLTNLERKTNNLKCWKKSMLILKQKICKCGKKALPNRRICWTCHLEANRKKREDKLAKQAVSKQKKKARFEQGETYRKRLMKEAWKVWSKYIRNKNVDDQGRAECFTCGIKMPPEHLQAGHFFHGRLNFDERNIHPQCVRCNKHLHGNATHYAVRLNIEGVDLKQLRRDAEIKGNGYSIKELQEIIAKFTK